MDSKKWYVSKGIWTGIVGVLLAVYSAAVAGLAAGCGSDPVGLCVHLPNVPEWVFGILAAFGIHARATANTTITK